eukprot:6184310-Pleurochrysis_carterae.AAC.1
MGWPHCLLALKEHPASLGIRSSRQHNTAWVGCTAPSLAGKHSIMCEAVLPATSWLSHYLGLMPSCPGLPTQDGPYHEQLSERQMRARRPVCATMAGRNRGRGSPSPSSSSSAALSSWTSSSSLLSATSMRRRRCGRLPLSLKSPLHLRPAAAAWRRPPP